MTTRNPAPQSLGETQTQVAVTGIGMITPLGLDTASTWEALLKGQSGVQRLEKFDASTFTTQMGAEVKGFDPNKLITDKKLLRQSVLFTRFALAAAEEAFDDAGIKPTATTADRWGIVGGSGLMTAEFDYWQDFQKEFAVDGKVDYHKLSRPGQNFCQPVDFARTRTCAGIGLLTQSYGIRGYSTTVHTACASGGQALGLAARVIRRGEADYMLAGGYDSMLNPTGLSSFCLLGALSTANDDPQTASRPFDLTRGGFVLGEGAAFLILESLEKAKARGARIYATLAGEGNSISAFRITDSPPSGDGPMQSIRAALSDAACKPTDVDYINAHGTSTKMNDLSETNAIKTVLGEHAYKIPVSSTKSLTGHLISASGALEGAIAVLAIHHGIAPMTANLTTPDPECDLDYVTEGAREASIGVAMSNSFGFGGTNNCLVFKHPDLANRGAA